MRIIRYIGGCKLAVALIACLLVVQAAAELALPDYTSKIVDVGIQQSGVEHAAVEEMTARTHDLVAMMLPEDDEQAFRDAYDETPEGTYRLNDRGKKDIDALDRMMALPLAAVHFSDRTPDLDLDGALWAYQADEVSKDQVIDMLDEARRGWAQAATPLWGSRLSPPPWRSTNGSATTCRICGCPTSSAWG